MRLARNDNASEYYNLIKNATIKALKDASSKLQPARVGYATGKAYVNTNRDQKLGRDTIWDMCLTDQPTRLSLCYPLHHLPVSPSPSMRITLSCRCDVQGKNKGRTSGSIS